MDEPDLFDVFVHPLHHAGIRYMIVGSVASIHYGEPRLTMDVDLVVQLQEPEISALLAAFSGADFYTPPPEIIAAEINRSSRGHFNVIHIPTGFKADFYPSGHSQTWAWERIHCESIAGRPVFFAPPECVVLSKLEFYREGGSEKHLRDIRGMLAVSGDQIDRNLIETKVAELGLVAAWRQACVE